MKPFSGIRIIDFTQAHAGSLATMLLADMGAEVVKIERAGSGDLARYWAPFRGESSGYYAFLNRGKKSVSLDLSKPEGKQAVKALIAGADVVCENFKYGSMERMGLTYEEVRAIKPDVIYASLNGFGQTGPMRRNIGLDLHLQAMGGVMDATGFPDGDPVRVGVAFGDHLSGTYMAQAISLALLERAKTGRGQLIDISILDALFSLQREQLAQGAGGPARRGNRSAAYAPCGCYPTADGWLLLYVTRDEQWRALCAALALDEPAARADLAHNAGRMAHEEELSQLLGQALSSRPREELEQTLRAAGVPCAAVRSVAQSMDDPRSQALLAQVDDKALGPVRFTDSHFHIDTIDTRVTQGAPLRGEHTALYLAQAGYSEEQLAALVNSGAAEMEVRP